ncbi:pyridoxal phosphate-dependent aminotransferase [Streptomyces sp. NPDC017095]|uniref:pyridoxal phosphate-dependent aminotransferase n=1 Tax=Streptomyces sp. NPDC017095 TaxID=3364977 RepID=UPI00379AF28D
MAGSVTSLFRGGTAHRLPRAAPAREDGDGSGPVDFRVPGNPYFPTPALFEELAGRLREIVTCRPDDTGTVTGELCSLLGLPPGCVALGNGCTELITWIDHLLVRRSLAVPVPSFGRWAGQAMGTGKRVDMFPLQEANGFGLDLARYAAFLRARGTRAAVLCNPNDPDGGFLRRRQVVRFLDAMADLDLVVVDESFLEFADAEDEPSVVREAVLRPNVVVLRSLGENLGLHGVRFGYLAANPALAGQVRSMLPEGNLNSFAGPVVAMLREHGAEYAHSLTRVRGDRRDMTGRLSALPGLTVYPSQGNFLFVRLPVGAEGPVVRDRLLAEHRVLVRECGDTLGSSSRFLRLAVRPGADVRRLVSGLGQVLYGSAGKAAAAAPGTGYSSGTAAVDRLVGETDGAGLRLPPTGPAPSTGTGAPLPAEVPPAPVPPAAGGTPLPAARPSPAPACPPLAPVPLPPPPAVAAAPTPPGVPARGGLTAAQVRGRTAPAPAPAPATGWPGARSWPDTAGPSRAAG